MNHRNRGLELFRSSLSAAICVTTIRDPTHEWLPNCRCGRYKFKDGALFSRFALELYTTLVNSLDRN